jgi:hypothetical protein
MSEQVARDSVVTAALAMLGERARDRVSGMEGMVDSVCFDAYGCVQASLAQRVGQDGKIPEGRWFDVKRLELIGQRVIDDPGFVSVAVGNENGPADKPPPRG